MAGPGFSKGKTVFVLCIVIGCFAILWPKIFYPMLSASLATGHDDSNHHMRPERPIHFRPDKMHPALREKGNAIPNTPPPQRTLEKEARPGPMPGVRPPIGGGAHMAQPAKGSGSMGIIMPLYTIGIVIFFVYTIMKVSHILFRKNEDEDEKRPCPLPIVKDFHRDSERRKLISISPHDDYYTQRTYQEILAKEAKAQNTTWANKKRPSTDNRRIEDEEELRSSEGTNQDGLKSSSISESLPQQEEQKLPEEEKPIEIETTKIKDTLTLSTEVKPTEVKRLKSEDEWIFDELVTAEADTDLDFEAEFEKLTAKKPKTEIKQENLPELKEQEVDKEERFEVLGESEMKGEESLMFVEKDGDSGEPTRKIVVEKESVKVEVDPEEPIEIIIKTPTEEIIPQISTNELGNDIEIVGIADEHNDNNETRNDEIGARDRDARDVEIDLLRKRLLETEAAMERIVKHMGSVSDRLSPTFMAKVLQAPTPPLKEENQMVDQPSILKKTSDSELRRRKPETEEKKKKAVTIQLPHQALSPEESLCEDDVKEGADDVMYAEELTNRVLKDLEQEIGKLESGGSNVSVVGFEETVSLSDGGKWVEGRGSSLSPTFRKKEKSPSPPVPSIFLEGALAAGNYVVSNSLCEETPLDYDADEEEDDDVAPVVLSGKVTLSVLTDLGENTEASSLSLDDPKFTSRDESNVPLALATAMDDNLKRDPDSTQIIPDIDEYEVLEDGESEEEEELEEEEEEEEDDDAEIDDDTNYSTADADGDIGDTAADISVLDGLEEKLIKHDEEE